MTAYGFDLDGTLDKPQITQMANDLLDAGHEVYVITGGLAEEAPWRMEDRVALLAKLGARYTEIIRCIAPNWEDISTLKGLACREKGVTVMLDDLPVFLGGVHMISPGTVCLLVYR